MAINLHELANTPGAGNATKELKKAGYWDEDAGRDSKVWVAKVTGTMSCYTSARSEAEAKRKVLDDVSYDFDEIEEIEVSEK